MKCGASGRCTLSKRKSRERCNESADVNVAGQLHKELSVLLQNVFLPYTLSQSRTARDALGQQ